MFQSSPGQLAGRFATGGSRPRPWRSFNPRPANWPGASPLLQCLGGGFDVSILARPIGRALPTRAAFARLMGVFQSSPGQLAGRFSAPIPASTRVRSFQSSPGQLAGRFPHRRRRGGVHGGFNPRPANWPGASPGLGIEQRVYAVSILARPIGRALLRTARCNFCGINVSILARPIGRALLCECHIAGESPAVSILARPIGRALRESCNQCSGNPAFQSSPGQLAGRFRQAHVRAASQKLFQSSPGQLAGRFLPVIPDKSVRNGFNPRPANWPGASNRAGCNRIEVVFQSSPGQLAGRFFVVSLKNMVLFCFNPRPANWPGASSSFH